MKTTCFVIALSVMVVCVTSRRISRTQIKDVYEGYVSDPSPCEEGCKKRCCEGKNGEDLCIQGSYQENVCKDECKNCEKQSLPGLMAKRRRTLYETLMAMARREEGDGEYPSESSYYTSPDCQSCRKTECGNVNDFVCKEICAC